MAPALMGEVAQQSVKFQEWRTHSKPQIAVIDTTFGGFKFKVWQLYVLCRSLAAVGTMTYTLAKNNKTLQHTYLASVLLIND